MSENSTAHSGFVDLHLHTNHSDGADSPRRVVERAVEMDLAAIAITDHDTVSGVEEAADAAAETGPELLAGVEISSALGGIEVHILGLGVDRRHGPFLDALQRQAEGRLDRARRMVERLNELGVPVDLHKVLARAADGAIGRMHVAQEIVTVGYAETVQGAFDKYIKAGRAAFVPKEVVAVDRAVEIIHQAGGLAFVAHPGLGGLHERLDTLLHYAFDGVEVYHSRHTPAMVKRLKEVASAKGLLVTGGSDCHGTIKGEAPLMGTAKVPYECFARLKAALAR